MMYVPYYFQIVQYSDKSTGAGILQRDHGILREDYGEYAISH